MHSEPGSSDSSPTHSSAARQVVLCDTRSRWRRVVGTRVVNLEVNQSNERSAGRCDVLIELVLMTIRRTDAHIRYTFLSRPSNDKLGRGGNGFFEK